MSSGTSTSVTPCLTKERQANVLLTATRPPSGSLQALPGCGEMNAMLVPEQAYLVRIRIAPYFQLRKVRTAAKAQPEYLVYGEDDEHIFATSLDPSTTRLTAPASAPVANATATTMDTSVASSSAPVSRPPTPLATGNSPRDSKRYETRLTVAQYDAINEVLQTFLRHHVLAFSRPSGASFTTAAGEQGEFSDVLDKVTLVSSGGLTGARVLGDLDPMNPLGNFMEQSRNVCCPASLPIYVTDRALLHEDELQAILVRLHSVVLSAQSSILPWAPDVSQQAQDTAMASAPEKPMPGVLTLLAEQHLDAANEALTQPPPIGPTAAAAVPARRYPNALHMSQSLRSEDLENDVTVEMDLTPFESKIEERRRRSLLHGATTTARAGDPTVLKGTPVLGPTQRPGEPVRGRAESASSSTGASRTATAPSTPPKVLQHEYSRESITNYRKVVAADNEIHYREFQLLMEQPMALPLVELLSMFVSEMQQREHVFLDNKPVLKLWERWSSRLASIPILSSSERKTLILNEGMEKYFTTKLYFRLYNVRPNEKRENTVLQNKWENMVTMPAEQLEALADVEKHHVWGQAMFELDGMNFFKSPREKLRCGMRACELLSLAVGDVLEKQRRVKQGAEAEGKGAATRRTPPPPRSTVAFGADEFLPCFMLLVLRAQPYNFCQNVKFIELFRSQDLMSPEECYCLANLCSAAAFWLRCDEHGRLPSVTKSNGSVGTKGDVAGNRAAAAATQCPPVLSENDLLPSVKNARQASETAAVAAKPPANAPNVLDTLFEWVNNVTHPANAHNASTATPVMESSSPLPVPTTQSETSGQETVSSPVGFIDRWRRSLDNSGSSNAAARSAPVQHGHIKEDAAGQQQGEAARRPSVELVQKGVTVASQTTAAKVRHLLLVQNKPFETLSVAELQLIVEEMRKRLQDSSS